MKKCIICDNELSAKQQKFCSKDCKNKSQQGKRVKLDPTIRIKCKLGGKIFRDYENRSGTLKRYSESALNKSLDWNDWDPNLTEWENMINLGYDRIWDCGSLRYIKTY